MKNLDFKMRERFCRREQDEERLERIQLKQLERMKAKDYSHKSDEISEDTCDDKFRKQLKRFNIR